MKTVKKNPITRAKSEKSYQGGIERMQIALLEGKVGATAIVERAEKELEVLKKNAAFFLHARKEEIASEYTTLQTIYKEDLQPLTLEVLQAKAQESALRFISRAQGNVSEKQEAIVSEYYAKKAEMDFAIRSTVENILGLKGLKVSTKPTKNQVEKEELISK